MPTEQVLRGPHPVPRCRDPPALAARADDPRGLPRGSWWCTWASWLRADRAPSRATPSATPTSTGTWAAAGF
ncbi:hypothetical protein QJS66_15180 [Kocuria rhizophila]|nr:hypothetical protein QJS66_15180 [Kocuria rhizophila]